ncbi:MAG: hypothetical protein Q8O67_32130 [Deltaproteobacteria bacterium]|nr:hypothetical protein [Deltaproteobacteria bacterium]
MTLPSIDGCTRVSVWRLPQPATHAHRDVASRAPAMLTALARKRALRLDQAAHVIFTTAQPRGIVLFHDDDADTPRAVTLGGHSLCALELPGACLRHVVLLAHSAGALDVIDLRTSVGLGVGDRSVVEAHSDGGPVSFTAGDDQVIVVPCRRGEPFALPAAATFSVLVPVARARCAPVIDEHARRQALASRYECTVVSDRSDRAAPTVFVRASLADLETGVLIGRYPRCEVSGALGVDFSISRVHALVRLVRAAPGPLGQTWPDRLLVVDCASTNGTGLVGANGLMRRRLDGDGGSAGWLRAGEGIDVHGHRVLIGLS